MLVGRVKTLHPKIPRRLALRCGKRGARTGGSPTWVMPIDIVVVIFPFEQPWPAKRRSPRAIENIEHRGPSMLPQRARTTEVTVVVDRRIIGCGRTNPHGGQYHPGVGRRAGAKCTRAPRLRPGHSAHRTRPPGTAPDSCRQVARPKPPRQTLRYGRNPNQMARSMPFQSFQDCTARSFPTTTSWISPRRPI